MKNAIFLLTVLLAASVSHAQSDSFDADIVRFLKVNGSSASYDVAFDQIVSQFMMMKPSIPDSVWKTLRTEVFDPEVQALLQKMVPVYKKHFTHEEIKGLNAFFESPLGKNFTEKNGVVTKEMMPLSQTWGMGLGQKINDYLTKKGY